MKKILKRDYTTPEVRGLYVNVEQGFAVTGVESDLIPGEDIIDTWE